MKTKYYIYIVYLLVITLAVTAVSFSKFSAAVEGSHTVEVARPTIAYIPQSLTIDGNPVADISGGISLTDLRPGDTLVYKFDIRNYEGSNTNEVLLKYLIAVVFDPAETILPLTYTLVPDDSYSSAGGGWTYMGYGTQITHSYTLTVTWDESDQGAAYLDQQQSIQIVINTQQAA